MPYVANHDLFICAKGLPNGHPGREEIVYLAGSTVPDALALSLANPPLCGEALFDEERERIGACQAESTHGDHLDGTGRCAEHKADDQQPLRERKWLIEDGHVSEVASAPPPAFIPYSAYPEVVAERIDERNAQVAALTATPEPQPLNL
ncbi:MAG: hypothetical protein KGR26_14480, partial [Cyanobacteria bacterium REEB65]|nr:hypothetical protein [Cyanobacteria bacterium REEB65]